MLVTSLANEFAETAIARDVKGGTPKHEGDRLRQSNLLKLIIPKEYGGLGETWITALQFTCELAKVDSSIAHVYLKLWLHVPPAANMALTVTGAISVLSLCTIQWITKCETSATGH